MKLSSAMRSIPVSDRGLFNVLFMLQHVVPSNERVHRWRDRIRLRIARRLERGGKRRKIQVERVKELSPSDFRRRYLATGTPVVIERGAADWPCTREWSFATFKRRFGKATLKLVHQKGLVDDEIVLDREYTEEMNFGDFLDQALRGGTRYMRFSPILEMFPVLLKDFDMKFLGEMPGPMSLGTMFEAFIGGKNTYTPLHHAPTPFFFVNAFGIKRWRMVPNHYIAVLDPPADGMSYNHSGADPHRPNVRRYPGLASVDWMEAVLRPGDILFMPSWLWHSVRNETPTIGVRCGLMVPRTMFGEAPTLFMIRTFLARNPSLPKVLYYTLLKRDLPERKNMLLQPKMVWNTSWLPRLGAFARREKRGGNGVANTSPHP